jgi:hypothetical protein
MEHDASGKAQGTPKKHGKKNQRNNADSRAGLESAARKGSEAGHFENSADHSVCSRTGTNGKRRNRSSSGGILRQLVLNNQAQLAFLEEQIQQLKRTQLQLKRLCEEFAKAEAEDIDLPNDEELE